MISIINCFSVLDFDSLEYARQMTLFDHKLLRRVRLEELLKRRFDKPESSPNISAISNHFNQVSCKMEIPNNNQPTIIQNKEKKQ